MINDICVKCTINTLHTPPSTQTPAKHPQWHTMVNMSNYYCPQTNNATIDKEFAEKKGWCENSHACVRKKGVKTWGPQ